LASRVRIGDRARRAGLFLIPEETDPPLELRDLRALLEAAQREAAVLPPLETDGFVRAAVDPFVNALHRALLPARRTLRPSIRAAREAILARALAQGPAAVTARERRILLQDPALTDALHRRVWGLPDRLHAARWGRPGATPPASP
jgi:membrane glycosyltransferase